LATQYVGATRRVAPTKANGKAKKPKEYPALTEAELVELPEGWCKDKMGNLTFQITDGTHI
jgi:hypothetical protein